MNQIINKSVLREEVADFVRDSIVPLVSQNSILTLTGPLGAGKTTIVQEILKNFGIKESVTSPTFAYVNTYYANCGRKIHHFDLYRISDVHAFINAGFDEYLQEQNALVLIEWPQVITPLLQVYKKIELVIDYDETSKEKRRIRLAF